MPAIRIRIIVTGFFVVWFLLLVKIYYLSIKSNDYYEEISRRNALKIEPIAPLRGAIKDRNDQPLSINKLGFAIELKPHLRFKSTLDLLDQKLDFICSVFPSFDKEKLKKEYLRLDSPYGHDFIRIVDFVPYDDMIPNFSKFLFDEEIRVVPASKRSYPHSKIASHIIGYVAKANPQDVLDDSVAKLTGFIGKSGIENSYNEILQGDAGYRKIKVTAHNEEIEEIERIPSKSRDLTLSIDLELQKYISEIFGEDSGAAVVMDIKTGQILAAGSYPEYDINLFVNGLSQDEWNALQSDLGRPFINKFTQGLYPPGSTIKMGVGLSFLENGMNEGTSFYCTSNFELGGRKFRCWKEHGHGSVDLRKAIRESCDDYFYKGSLKTGVDEISKTLQKLGLGQKTGIDLEGEFVGTVPDKQWKLSKHRKPWYMGETLITSIGQGYFLSTPLQIAVYTAVLATGKKPIPHFVKKIENEPVLIEPQDVLNDFEKSKLAFLQKAMYEVCNVPGGTATPYLNVKFPIAGKTGTSQVVGISQSEKKRMKESDMEYYKRSHAWLTTYGPFENPQYVVTVLMEHGGHGGHAAAPNVSKIYNKLLELGYIKLNKEEIK